MNMRDRGSNMKMLVAGTRYEELVIEICLSEIGNSVASIGICEIYVKNRGRIN